MRRVRLTFAGRVVVFADRDRALGQVEELAERGTYPVHVIYGPEGCGRPHSSSRLGLSSRRTTATTCSMLTR